MLKELEEDIIEYLESENIGTPVKVFTEVNLADEGVFIKWEGIPYVNIIMENGPSFITHQVIARINSKSLRHPVGLYDLIEVVMSKLTNFDMDNCSPMQLMSVTPPPEKPDNKGFYSSTIRFSLKSRFDVKVHKKTVLPVAP